jgi:hypothetical protein
MLPRRSSQPLIEASFTAINDESRMGREILIWRCHEIHVTVEWDA